MSLHVVHLCGNTISEEAQALINEKLKPVKISGMKEMNKYKLQLIERINKTVRSSFMEKHEEIYNSVKVKEMQTEWKSLRKSYEKVPLLKNRNKNKRVVEKVLKKTEPKTHEPPSPWAKEDKASQ